MLKYFMVAACLLLPGCQLATQGTQSNTDHKGSCRLNAADLDRMQTIEGRFLSKPEQRSRIMQQAINSKDTALLALLLSTPLSSSEQLQQAKRHFAKLVLYPDPSCPGDRYLDLRNQLATTLMWMRAEQDNLLKENRALQVKIDALTQIETDLSKERNEQE